jgi:hypothetical protein
MVGPSGPACGYHPYLSHTKEEVDLIPEEVDLIDVELTLRWLEVKMIISQDP